MENCKIREIKPETKTHIVPKWMIISESFFRGSDHVIWLLYLLNIPDLANPESWHLYKRKKMENHSLTCSTNTRHGGLQFANMISWAAKK